MTLECPSPALAPRGSDILANLLWQWQFLYTITMIALHKHRYRVTMNVFNIWK